MQTLLPGRGTRGSCLFLNFLLVFLNAFPPKSVSKFYEEAFRLGVGVKTSSFCVYFFPVVIMSYSFFSYMNPMFTETLNNFMVLLQLSH